MNADTKVKIESILGSNNVVLFMKGTPRCPCADSHLEPQLS